MHSEARAAAHFSAFGAKRSMWFKKASPRRQAIREDVAEAESQTESAGKGRFTPFLVISAAFFLVACLIQFWPANQLPYRPGDSAPTDFRAPVDFGAVDSKKTEAQREAPRAASPPELR